jgi:hypothetical protein
MSDERIPPLAMEAVRDPYTPPPGAFTSARVLGLVEVHEGQPVLTGLGHVRLALHERTGPIRAQGCPADEHGPADPEF